MWCPRVCKCTLIMLGSWSYELPYVHWYGCAIKLKCRSVWRCWEKQSCQFSQIYYETPGNLPLEFPPESHQNMNYYVILPEWQLGPWEFCEFILQNEHDEEEIVKFGIFYKKILRDEMWFAPLGLVLHSLHSHLAALKLKMMLFSILDLYCNFE